MEPAVEGSLGYRRSFVQVSQNVPQVSEVISIGAAQLIILTDTKQFLMLWLHQWQFVTNQGSLQNFTPKLRFPTINELRSRINVKC